MVMNQTVLELWEKLKMNQLESRLPGVDSVWVASHDTPKTPEDTVTVEEAGNLQSISVHRYYQFRDIISQPW